jgi:23S rRNA pseudouridine1911/1915/1917 synthase
VDNGQITKLTFEIEAAAHKQKLGEYLFDNLRDLSKMYLRELIKTGKCEVNGNLVNSGYRLRPRDFIEIEADLSRGTAMRPEAVELNIVFEDDEIIVVNKPAGMLVHPSHRENSGTLLNALSFYLNISSRKLIRPGLPHRLDKQTSGLIVVAKTPRAHRILSGHFMRKRVEKLYLALVDGVVSTDEGSMNAPIGRHAEIKHWGVKHDGKVSETNFRVKERFADTTLLELEPVTGRTNQLRIHCEAIGHPIVGDTRRGGSRFNRLCLHAWQLAFPHPTSRERMEFQSEVQADFPLPKAAF